MDKNDHGQNIAPDNPKCEGFLDDRAEHYQNKLGELYIIRPLEPETLYSFLYTSHSFTSSHSFPACSILAHSHSL